MFFFNFRNLNLRIAMPNPILDLFTDPLYIDKIKSKLPRLFRMAEIETTRGGKIGMEVGNVREKIIIALLVKKYGKDNVDDDIPTTVHSVDVKVSDYPFSIKTSKTKLPKGFKLSWTVDTGRAIAFLNNFQPDCDIIYVHYEWGFVGGLYYIPLSAQLSVFKKLGRANYIKMPTPNTNPRGIEIQTAAVRELTKHKETLSIDIRWDKPETDYNPVEKWIKDWGE
jgi:hypothetical protein